MERRASFLQHFGACYFRTVETARDLHLDALRSSTHSVLDSHLDGAAVCYLALYLASDRVCYDVGIEVRLLYLEDVYLDVLLVELLQLFLELVDILSTFTNDEARAGSSNSDGDTLQSALDDDA